MGLLETVVANELRDSTRGTIENISDVINDLIGAIVRLGHGGMILVADTQKKSHFRPYREVLWGDLLADVLCQYWDAVADAQKAAGGKDRLLALARQGTSTAGLLNIAKSTMMIEKAVDTIAHLAGVDGAIVFTNSLRIGAFNAIIDRIIPPPTCRLVDVAGAAIDEAAFVAHHGSRHQSALLYAKSIPGSFTFVISQDGSVSAFHNKDAATVIYQTDMRVLE